MPNKQQQLLLLLLYMHGQKDRKACVLLWHRSSSLGLHFPSYLIPPAKRELPCSSFLSVPPGPCLILSIFPVPIFPCLSISPLCSPPRSFHFSLLQYCLTLRPRPCRSSRHSACDISIHLIPASPARRLVSFSTTVYTHSDIRYSCPVLPAKLDATAQTNSDNADGHRLNAKMSNRLNRRCWPDVHTNKQQSCGLMGQHAAPVLQGRDWVACG